MTTTLEPQGNLFLCWIDPDAAVENLNIQQSDFQRSAQQVRTAVINSTKTAELFHRSTH